MVASSSPSPVVSDHGVERSESLCDPPIYLGVLVGCSYEQYGVSRAADLCVDPRPFSLNPPDGGLCCPE